MFSRRTASALPISARSRVERLEPPQAGGELLAAPAEAVAGALEQQLQVGAGVAVERRQDLVGLHVGLGLRERDRRAVRHLLALRARGRARCVMSWRPVRGRSSTVASVWISGAYCCSISIVTTAWPSSRSTLEMSPTLTPAMFTVWPWPGRDRLRGRELGLELEPVVAEERAPRTGRAAAAGRGCSRSPAARRTAAPRSR